MGRGGNINRVEQMGNQRKSDHHLKSTPEGKYFFGDRRLNFPELINPLEQGQI